MDQTNPRTTRHLATVQVTAEPNGYAVFKNLKFDSIHATRELAMMRAQEIVREYKPDYNAQLD